MLVKGSYCIKKTVQKKMIFSAKLGNYIAGIYNTKESILLFMFTWSYFFPKNTKSSLTLNVTQRK